MQFEQCVRNRCVSRSFICATLLLVCNVDVNAQVLKIADFLDLESKILFKKMQDDLQHAGTLTALEQKIEQKLEHGSSFLTSSSTQLKPSQNLSKESTLQLTSVAPGQHQQKPQVLAIYGVSPSLYAEISIDGQLHKLQEGQFIRGKQVEKISNMGVLFRGEVSMSMKSNRKGSKSNLKKEKGSANVELPTAEKSKTEFIPINVESN